MSEPAAEPAETNNAEQSGEDKPTSSNAESTASQPTQSSESKKAQERYTKKVLEFAGKHRVVLNQILRENNSTMESMMSVLSQFPTLLEFDVKRKYFYREIKKLEGRSRLHDDVVVRIRRSHLFSDAYRELFRLRPADWKQRFYIVFEGEEGQDAGGLLREFFSVITREIFNPNYALFSTIDGVTYAINLSSFVNPEHLLYFKFAGHIIAKAIYDQKQLDCYFTRALYKQILNLPVSYNDLESFDNEYYKNLMFLLENPIETAGVELNFNLEVEEFGVRSWRELKENGNNIPVTDDNKEEYIRLVCHEKLTIAVKKQLDAFLEGFYEIIPRQLISIFNEQELELLISGLPEIDIDDLAANTELKQYTKTSPQVQWLFRALREFDAADKAKFLQFVFGSSKVPLNGFAELQGMNGIQKFTIQKDTRSADRLPAAHSCFNQIDLPPYENYDKLKEMVLKAIRECQSFGLV
ncbi:E3 ubiquitin-protein ligase HUWE1 [Aphelenchoides bicaudatus]|nr:E3 ubiquitin-protein ligase HUWE1 [Aphelenchoides bicaudatus]